MWTKRGIIVVVFLLPLMLGAQRTAPSHSAFSILLKKYVTADGRVDYTAFQKDSVALNNYLALITAHPPNEKTWSSQEQFAYWINAYNAFTIQLVLRHYPLKSIKDIGASWQIPFVNSPWDLKFFKIGVEKMDLNTIEHGILRKKFADPRLHMVLVCASKSCPVLLNEAYDPARLEEQMNRQTAAFLADPFRNKITAHSAQISMIFKWYEMDFNRKGNSIRTFINAHSAIKLNPGARISYLEYDWELNDK